MYQILRIPYIQANQIPDEVKIYKNFRYLTLVLKILGAMLKFNALVFSLRTTLYNTKIVLSKKYLISLSVF